MISAAILIGGRARRFGGRDKSSLLVDGRPILERQIATLAPLTDDLLIVGSRGPVGSSFSRIQNAAEAGSHDPLVGSSFSWIRNPAEAGSHVVRFVADRVPD